MTTNVQSLFSIEEELESRKLKDCSKCVHLNVCSVYRAIAPLIENSFKDKKPFVPTELAIICKEFMPIIASNVLKRKETE